MLLFAIPLVGKHAKGGHLFSVIGTTALFLGMVALAAMTYWHDAHSAEYPKALAEGPARAHRVKELAQSRGIPSEDALALLRNDAQTQGPKLYEQNCASCHGFQAHDRTVYGDEEPTASDLTGLGSAGWIAGWFDKNKITSPAYFGNTAFKDGTMVDFVHNTLGDLLKELAEEDDAYKTALEDLVACLAAEARLEKPRKADADEEAVEGIEEETLFLFEDLTCTDCHRFYHLGGLGDAPDLTGYMSRDWLQGIVKDPTDERFYGDSNDRMPVYHKSADDYTLSQKQIDMLLDWIQGTWSESAGDVR